VEKAETLALKVEAWSGSVVENGNARQGGAIAEASEIPAQMRRRLPAFAREAMRCGLALMRAAPESDLVFASRHGDLISCVALLTDLANSALLSPATFSTSVHNASAGIITQCLSVPSSHTATACGAHSLQAGLTDAYARLASGEAHSVILVHADDVAPPIYDGFDEDGPGVYLGLRLSAAIDEADEAATALPGRAGVAALNAALAAGARTVRFTPPHLEGASS
jgi:hypothetical protein